MKIWEVFYVGQADQHIKGRLCEASEFSIQNTSRGFNTLCSIKYWRVLKEIVYNQAPKHQLCDA